MPEVRPVSSSLSCPQRIINPCASQNLLWIIVSVTGSCYDANEATYVDLEYSPPRFYWMEMRAKKKSDEPTGAHTVLTANAEHFQWPRISCNNYRHSEFLDLIVALSDLWELYATKECRSEP